MTPDRWAMVKRLYRAARARPIDERAAFLAEACAGEEDLRREVESLLAQGASADGGLTRGAVVAAATITALSEPADDSTSSPRLASSPPP